MRNKKHYDYEIVYIKKVPHIKSGNRILSLKVFNNVIYNGKSVNCDDCPFRSELCLCELSSNDDDCPLTSINERGYNNGQN